jgi:pyruvate dehydrogenase complex dehydrogenase (E1) component
VVAGAFFTFHEGREWHGRFGRHSHSVVEWMRDRMQSQLDLTPEQVAKLSPVLDHAAGELQQIRAETGAKVRQVMNETHEAVKPILSDAQREKLAKLEKTPHPNRGVHKPGRRRAARTIKAEPDISPD